MYKTLLFLIALLIPVSLLAQTTFNKNVYFGMQNNADVVRLQNFLKSQGYFNGLANGSYDIPTLHAVMTFQYDHGIPAVGGYFGPQSRIEANRILAPRPAPTPASTPSQTNSGMESGGTGVTGGMGDTFIPPAPPQAPPGNPSYKGKLVISSVSGTSQSPVYESITIRNQTEKETIPLTGFRIENSYHEAFVIPDAYGLPGLASSSRDPIFLKPGDYAVITAGTQERRMDFRENLCTGYFTQSSQFIPDLTQQCPRPDTSRILYLTDECIRKVESVSLCRMPNVAGEFNADCAAFLSEHYRYSACVDENRADPNFYSHRWLIWMQRNTEFLRNVHDVVQLLDSKGKVVSEWDY